MIFMLVDTSEGLMSVPVFDTDEELRQAWDTGRLTMNDPCVYMGRVCEVRAANRGELVLMRLD